MLVAVGIWRGLEWMDVFWVAVETLGSATVICSDKTGTLTMNEMMVRKLYVDGNWIEFTGEGYDGESEFRRGTKTLDTGKEESMMLLLKIGALCNDALLSSDKEWCNIVGDPTEGALLVVAAKAGLNEEEIEETYPRLDEIPFQSERRYMATLHQSDGGKVVYVKGAVKKLLEMSQSILKDAKLVPLKKADKEAIVQVSDTMAKDAMRVISLVSLNSLREKPSREPISRK